MAGDEPYKPGDSLDLTLLANFVHQVVNPLNGVAGTLDNLAEGIIKEEARRTQRLAAARAQIEECITLMRNLAFLAKGSGSISSAEQKTVVLPQVIIEAAMFFQEDGKTKLIQIHLNDPHTQNRVVGRPELVRQVLMNIFDNCVKYGMPNSKIIVEQRIQSGTANAIIVVKGQSKYPLNSDELQRIFELGYRGENAKQIVASGTGLGLYICKQIVERDHGGQLHVQTVGSNGIEFTIKLPGGQSG